jgi:hypothetical protein
MVTPNFCFMVIMNDTFQKSIGEPVVVWLMYDEIQVQAEHNIRVFKLR